MEVVAKTIRRLLLAPSSAPWWASTSIGASAATHRESLIFFVGGRATDNRSRIGMITLDSDELSRTGARLSKEPILDVGPSDSYYRDGVSYPSLYKYRGEEKLLFTGWRRVGNTFENHLGVADFCESSGSWRPQMSPLFKEETLGTGSATVVESDDGDFLIVTRFLGWSTLGRKWIPFYRPWIAELDEGGTWRLVTELQGLETLRDLAIARPMWMQYEKNTLLWLSVRSGNKYRIIAGSLDGRRFQEDPSLCIHPEGAGAWDSQSVEYAAPFKRAGKLAVLYNGDGFGSTGIGIATYEMSSGGNG